MLPRVYFWLCIQESHLQAWCGPGWLNIGKHPTCFTSLQPLPRLFLPRQQLLEKYLCICVVAIVVVVVVSKVVTHALGGACQELHTSVAVIKYVSASTFVCL